MAKNNEIKGFDLPEWVVNSQFVPSLFVSNAEDITINLILIKGIQSLIADVSLEKAEELSNEFLADIEWTKDQLSKTRTALEWANLAIFELEEKLKTNS